MIYERLFEHIKFATYPEDAAVHHTIDESLRRQGSIVACAKHDNVNLSFYCRTGSKVRCHNDKTLSVLQHSAVRTAKIDLAQTHVPFTATLAITNVNNRTEIR